MAGDEYAWNGKSWLFHISDPLETCSACLRMRHADEEGL